MEKLTDKQIEALKRPLPPEAIKPHPTKSYLSTIKAIYVVERFNEVFGLGGWLINNEIVEAGEKNIIVKSTFQAPGYGITIPDIFGGNDNTDRGDAFKGACTDALTKIASYLYVGMDVYKGLRDEHKEEVKPEVPTKESYAIVDGALDEAGKASTNDQLLKIHSTNLDRFNRKEITASQWKTITGALTTRKKAITKEK
jgi:hypothetical protein